MVQPLQYNIAVAQPVSNYLNGLKFGQDLKSQKLNHQIAHDNHQAQLTATQNAEAAAQQGQAALSQLLENPNPTTDDYLQVWAANPTIRDEVMKLRDMKDAEQTKAAVSQSVNLYAAARSKNVSVVRSLLTQERDAARNSGDEQTVFENDAALRLTD